MPRTAPLFHPSANSPSVQDILPFPPPSQSSFSPPPLTPSPRRSQVPESTKQPRPLPVLFSHIAHRKSRSGTFDDDATPYQTPTRVSTPPEILDPRPESKSLTRPRIPRRDLRSEEDYPSSDFENIENMTNGVREGRGLVCRVHEGEGNCLFDVARDGRTMRIREGVF